MKSCRAYILIYLEFDIVMKDYYAQDNMTSMSLMTEQDKPYLIINFEKFKICSNNYIFTYITILTC